MSRRTGRSVALGEQALLQLDSPLMGGPSNQRNIMVYPFFDLDRKSTRTHLTFHHGDTRIEVKALSGQGVATIYDRDLVIYAASIYSQIFATDPEADRRDLVFSAHDFFDKTNRDKSMRSYEMFEGMIERLKGTSIKTNVETGGKGITGWFSWLGDGTAIVYDTDRDTGVRRMKCVRVILCDWLIRAIKLDKQMFAVPSTYFNLRPVQRRLYDLARINCDQGVVWSTTLGELHAAVGSNVPVSRFKSQVREAVEDGIPEFNVVITEDFIAQAEGARKGGRRSVADQIVILSPKSTIDGIAGETTAKPVTDAAPAGGARRVDRSSNVDDAMNTTDTDTAYSVAPQPRRGHRKRLEEDNQTLRLF